MDNLMGDLIEEIEEWATKRGLDKADSSKQLLKLQEELGELTQGHLKSRTEQVHDSIGDLFVVLTIYCLQQDIDLYECVGEAYDMIKNRSGKMINGVFVKTEDLLDTDKN